VTREHVRIVEGCWSDAVVGHGGSADYTQQHTQVTPKCRAASTEVRIRQPRCCGLVMSRTSESRGKR
jgi:hypothetical protein